MVNTFQTSGQTVQSLDKEKKIPNGPNNEFCTSIDKVGWQPFYTQAKY